MRRLLIASALVLSAFLPGAALAGEGCSHGKDAATSASAEGAPAGQAKSCGEGCPHAAMAAKNGGACPHAAMADGGSCKAAAQATTAATATPGAPVASGSVADAE